MPRCRPITRRYDLPGSGADYRLYAEAAIPAGTGFVVWLAATDQAEPPPVDRLDAWEKASGYRVRMSLVTFLPKRMLVLSSPIALRR